MSISNHSTILIQSDDIQAILSTRERVISTKLHMDCQEIVDFFSSVFSIILHKYFLVLTVETNSTDQGEQIVSFLPLKRYVV